MRLASLEVPMRGDCRSTHTANTAGAAILFVTASTLYWVNICHNLEAIIALNGTIISVCSPSTPYRTLCFPADWFPPHQCQFTVTHHDTK